MTTCRACDALLQPHEGKWNPELKEHDELCSKCQGASFDSDPPFKDEIDKLYNTPYNYNKDY